MVYEMKLREQQAQVISFRLHNEQERERDTHAADTINNEKLRIYVQYIYLALGRDPYGLSGLNAELSDRPT